MFEDIPGILYICTRHGLKTLTLVNFCELRQHTSQNSRGDRPQDCTIQWACIQNFPDRSWIYRRDKKIKWNQLYYCRQLGIWTFVCERVVKHLHNGTFWCSICWLHSPETDHAARQGEMLPQPSSQTNRKWPADSPWLLYLSRPAHNFAKIADKLWQLCTCWWLLVQARTQSIQGQYHCYSLVTARRHFEG